MYEIIGVLAIITGVICNTQDPSAVKKVGEEPSMTGTALALLASCFCALYFCTIETLLAKYHPLMLYFNMQVYQFILSVGIAMLYLNDFTPA